LASDIREWAVKGAEQRLLEIAEEAKAIFRAFPELRGKGRGFEAQELDREPAPARFGQRRMSAAARRRISEAQKARWARQEANASPRSEVTAAVKSGSRKKR
jgi:hypothetical protein